MKVAMLIPAVSAVEIPAACDGEMLGAAEVVDTGPVVELTLPSETEGVVLGVLVCVVEEIEDKGAVLIGVVVDGCSRVLPDDNAVDVSGGNEIVCPEVVILRAPMYAINSLTKDKKSVRKFR